MSSDSRNHDFVLAVERLLAEVFYSVIWNQLELYENNSAIPATISGTPSRCGEVTDCRLLLIIKGWF